MPPATSLYPAPVEPAANCPRRAGWIGVTDVGSASKEFAFYCNWPCRRAQHAFAQASVANRYSDTRNRPAEARTALPAQNRQYRVGAVIGIGVDLKRYSRLPQTCAFGERGLSCSEGKKHGAIRAVICSHGASPDPEASCHASARAGRRRPSGC